MLTEPAAHSEVSAATLPHLVGEIDDPLSTRG